ncbi:MAG: nucleotide exchange factor GrpE [Candidatus Thermoplasmatota archaeon]
MSEEMTAASLENEEMRRKAEGYDALYAQLQLAVADLENYKKRVAREREEMQRCAVERVVGQMLEPAENLARALAASKGARSVARMRKGLEMIERQMWSALESNGLRRIEARGKQFDPMEHEAVARIETMDVEDGTVIEEVQPGYTLNGRVLRYAKVKVAQSPPQDADVAKE